jgi:hypothetical protein
MAGLIISSFLAAESYVLQLQTSERNDISNEQHRTLIYGELLQSDQIEKDYPLARFKGQVTPIYNCHGLTFASRRTWIYASQEIEKILRDDKYIEIKEEKAVLPGDVVAYYEDTEIVHTGIVVQVDLPQVEHDLIKIMIWSKWGKCKEAIHHVNYSPYINTIKRYWRMNHGFRIV